MSKELDLVNKLIEGIDNYEKQTCIKNPPAYISRETLVELQQALLELKAIDNANPSEALECLEDLKLMCGTRIELDKFPEYDIIKQYILKAQEQEKENEKLKCQVKYLTEVVTEFQKTLTTIFSKNVDILELSILIEHYNDNVALKRYNSKRGKELQLTKEEFDTLKRYTKNE